MESSTITKDCTETEAHFRMRREVYERALAGGATHDRAVVLSAVFRNSYFMGCAYPEEVIKES